jgi:hypothetical protein
MNSTTGEEALSVGLLMDWSNCPKVLLSIAALGVSDSLFRRLYEVELRSNDGNGCFQSFVAGCCGCAGSDDEDGGRVHGSRRKRRGRHHGVSRDSVSRDSVSSMLEVEGHSSRDVRHLAQPALQLCFAAAILSASLVVHTVSPSVSQCAHTAAAHDA